MKFFGRIADYIRECDKIMFILCIFATSFGCISVLSATRHTGELSDFLTQVIAMLLGLTAAVVISLFDFSTFIKYWPLAAAVGLIPVILTFFIGYAPPGTDDKAWLYVFGISFQPSELLKAMFLITFSAHLTAVKERINELKNLLLLCAHGFTPAVLIHFQGDDGTALVFIIMALGMMYAAGVRLRYFLFALSGLLVASPFIYFFVMNDDQRTRIWSIFNIEADIKGAGYQQYRGRVALANGGWFGQGYLKGSLTQSAGVPEGHNDFIFTLIGEEWGFVGCMVVILVLGAICLRCLHVARMCRKDTGKYICIGVFAMLLTHIIINIGMCTSILPVIGITLPFFSAGGASLGCLYLSVGLVLSVYNHRNDRMLYLRDA
ncbi:MAG: FtsW/RodA/SpoVE family cell cycle protein [Acutalibacteraceae bacterium]|nr:FtsW/RodA/SpoVE family cell cycle protein [Acutalibacteraceae bacterium]